MLNNSLKKTNDVKTNYSDNFSQVTMFSRAPVPPCDMVKKKKRLSRNTSSLNVNNIDLECVVAFNIEMHERRGEKESKILLSGVPA
jgi:hypothetical protein